MARSNPVNHSRHSRRFGRLGRIAGTLLVALLIAVATIAVVVETEWFKNWLRIKLVSSLANVLDGELRVGRLGGSLWTGVTLDNLELLNRDGQVVRADRVRVRYDPFTLARRRWIVDTVVIERASITVTQTADGWNVQHLTKPRPRSGNPLTVVIRDLELADSTVTIDAANAAPRTLTDVDVDSSLTVRDGVVSMTFASVHAFDSVTGLTLRETVGSASDNFKTFEIKLTADSSAMSIGGTVRGDMAGTTRVLTADIQTRHLDLAALLGRPPLSSDITGRVNAQATIPAQGGAARVTFKFSGPGSRALGYSAERIDASGEIAGGAVTFDSRVSAYGAHASVRGKWRWAAPGRAATFTGRGTFASLDVSRLPANLKLPRLDSRIAGTFDTAIDGRGWRAYANFSGGVVEGAAIGAGTEAHVQSSGGLTSYGAVGTASHVDVQRFGRAVPVPAIADARFASDLSGDFFVAGQNRAGAEPLLVGGAVLHDSTMAGTAVSELGAVTYLEERRLVVSANGRFENLNDTALAVPQVPFVATGDAAGWFVIEDIDQPISENNIELSARADLGPSTIRGVAMQSATVDGQLMDGALTLNVLELHTDGAKVRASGALGLHEPIATSDGAAAATRGVVLAAEITDRSFLERMLQRPLLTAGTIDATITGTLESPSATGTVMLRETAYGESVSALTTTARFTADWPGRDLEKLSYKLDGDAVFATLGATEIQRLAVTAAGGLRDMAIDVTAEQKDRSLGIEGQLTLAADSRALLLRRLALTTANIEWSLPQGRTAVITYGRDRVDVDDLTLVRGTQQIAIAGGFDLSTEASPTASGKPLELRLLEVELADVNRALLGTRQLTGRINGTVTITGNRAAPAVAGDLSIVNGMVQGVPYRSVQASGRYEYAAGVATIDAVLDQAPGASLKATGTVPVGAKAAAGESMNLNVTGGPVNLGLVQAFTDELDKVVGDAALDLRVTGSISDPVVAGTATLVNGGFVVNATGVAYQSVEASLEFTDGRMSVRQLRLLDPAGHEMTATGGLDIRRGISSRALDIQLRAQSFAVLANRFGNAAMDADVRVTGELGAPVVRGTATLESGRIEVADLLEQTTARPYATTPQAAVGAEQAGPARAQTPWERADIALEVRLPDNLVLRGRNLRVSGSGFGIGDMNVITGGTFDVTKRPNAPVDVRGTLEIVSGSYSFQGRRFEIERGSDVRFPGGGSLTDPLVNLNATREVSGVTAEVRVRGSARSPELTLSSRPPLDESDILSLIVFNQPVSSLGSAEQVNLGERAAAMAAGAITSPLADSIGRALNLDVFEIQAPTSDNGTGAVVIGSQLGSRVLVGLKQQFGHSETSLVTLEYRVNRLLRFITSVASGTLQAHATRRADRGGVDLIFVIRY
jgi:autotransporter translocation and assembly factor TamB